MLRSILVPLDGSSVADRILGHVRRIVAREPAEVMMLRVLPDHEAWYGLDLTGRELDSASEHLEGKMGLFTSVGAHARFDFMTGPPAEQILKFAHSYQPSLIAMSTHGHAGMGRFAHGNVAQTIVRHSPFPVLLCSPPSFSEMEISAAPAFRRILVPLDGSAHAAMILPWVEYLARLGGSEVILMHADSLVGDLALPPAGGSRPLADDVDRLLEEPMRRLRSAGISVKFRRVVGPAWASILWSSVEEQADLVAITTHGRSGLSRLVLGSVAEEVIPRCPCPVFVRRISGYVDVPEAAFPVGIPAWREA